MAEDPATFKPPKMDNPVIEGTVASDQQSHPRICSCQLGSRALSIPGTLGRGCLVSLYLTIGKVLYLRV